MLAWITAITVALLAAGAAVWCLYRRQTRYEAGFIHAAITARDREELLLLIAARSDLTAVSRYFGEPALILAAKSSSIEIVQTLLAYGVDVDERGTEWRTALIHAAAAGNRDLCHLLLLHGADIDARDMFGRNAADWAEQEGCGGIARELRRVGRMG